MACPIFCTRRCERLLNVLPLVERGRFGLMVTGAGGANSGRVLTVVRFAETMDANGDLHRPFQFDTLVLCVFRFFGQKEKYCLPHQIWCAAAGEGSVNTAVKQGPNVSVIAPVFSNDLNGYQSFMARTGIDKLTAISRKWSSVGRRHAAAVATTQVAIALALR